MYQFTKELTDHLGNNVVLFQDTDEDGIILSDKEDENTDEILDRMFYYPFGMQYDGTFNTSQAIELANR